MKLASLLGNETFSLLRTNRGGEMKPLVLYKYSLILLLCCVIRSRGCSLVQKNLIL